MNKLSMVKKEAMSTDQVVNDEIINNNAEGTDANTLASSLEPEFSGFKGNNEDFLAYVSAMKEAKIESIIQSLSSRVSLFCSESQWLQLSEDIPLQSIPIIGERFKAPTLQQLCQRNEVSEPKDVDTPALFSFTMDFFDVNQIPKQLEKIYWELFMNDPQFNKLVFLVQSHDEPMMAAAFVPERMRLELMDVRRILQLAKSFLALRDSKEARRENIEKKADDLMQQAPLTNGERKEKEGSKKEKEQSTTRRYLSPQIKNKGSLGGVNGISEVEEPSDDLFEDVIDDELQ